MRELAIATLKTVPQSFLVLQTDEQLALPTVDGGGWLLGPRRGQAWQDLGHVIVNDDIGDIVHVGGAIVEQDEPRAVGLGHLR